MRSFALVALGLFATSALASGQYPWESHDSKCTSIYQNDGKRIGAVCPYADNTTQTQGVVVYYFGFLQDALKYGAPYANLSLNAIKRESYMRMGMKASFTITDRDQPGIQVYQTQFVLCGLFNCGSTPKETDFAIYFQAEEKRPTHSPPFDYDNLFNANYRGDVSLVPNF